MTVINIIVIKTIKNSCDYFSEKQVSILFPVLEGYKNLINHYFSCSVLEHTSSPCIWDNSVNSKALKLLQNVSNYSPHMDHVLVKSLDHSNGSPFHPE